MSSTTRAERQLARQRGAGNYKTSHVDFGLTSGVAGGREERQLMRQRGAGNRMPDSVDFGLSFQTPARARRSSTKTPRTGRGANAGELKTQHGSGRESSVAQSASAQSVRISRRSMSGKTGDISRQSGNKGDRLNTGGHFESNTQTTTLPPSSSVARPASSRRPSLRRRTSGAVFDIAEEPEAAGTGNPPQPDELISSPGNGHSPSLVLFPNQEQNEIDNDKENSRPGVTKEITKRKKRTSIGQQSVRKKKRLSNDSLPKIILPTVEANNDEDVQPENLSAEEAEATFVSVTQDRESSGNLHKTQPNAAKKRKKRKSIAGTREKRKSLEVATSVSRDSPSPLRRDSSTSAGGQHALPTASPQTSVVENLAGGFRRHKRKLVPRLSTHATKPTQPWTASSPLRVGMDAEEDGDETYVDEDHSPEPPTPAPHKRRRTGGQESGTSNVNEAQVSSSKKSSFPIVIHRMANISALPTLLEADEPDEEASGDETLRRPALTERTAPNAIDVLAQICRETIETAIERTGYEKPSGNRADLKRKRAAMEAFSVELDGRLFDMSTAVESGMVLEGRLRRSKREKDELQTRWIEIRRQREQIALKCDDVRRRHWDDEEESRTKWAISEAANNVEMHLDDDQRGYDEELEYMLRSVAGDVSNVAHGGGLLDRLKSFNGQLERLAVVLDSR